MPFQYTYKPNPKISDIYNSLSPGAIPGGSMASSLTSFMPTTRTLPNGAGTFQSPIVTPENFVPKAPTAPAVSTPAKKVVATPAPVVTETPAQTLDYSKYTNPVTGAVMTPQEYADSIATKLTSGAIPTYAGNTLTEGPQTTEQLQSTAAGLNNERNDIKTGATDPYKVASQSGIAYSPAELAAIEKAYAGIYDPAINSALAKLDAKQKEDAATLASTNKLKEMAQQHAYDVSLKQTPTAAESMSGTTVGTYTPGADATVDAWAERIQNGTAKITDIPAKESALRNKVTVALTAQGNSATGKPTTTEIGLQTLDVAKRLKEMFDKGQGTSTVGMSRLFGGGLAVPGSDSANFINLFNTLIANKSLEGVKFLKGQGQVSDAERLLLKQAMSELNLNQSEEAFGKTLQTMIDKLEGNAGGGVLTSPDGTQEVTISDLTPDELAEAKANGWK